MPLCELIIEDITIKSSTLKERMKSAGKPEVLCGLQIKEHKVEEIYYIELLKSSTCTRSGKGLNLRSRGYIWNF